MPFKPELEPYVARAETLGIEITPDMPFTHVLELLITEIKRQTKMNSKTIYVSDTMPMQKLLGKDAAQIYQEDRPCETFFGIPIKIDGRLPYGVYCVIQPGGTLLSQDTVVGYFSEQYRDVYENFMRLLNLIKSPPRGLFK